MVTPEFPGDGMDGPGVETETPSDGAVVTPEFPGDGMDGPGVETETPSDGAVQLPEDAFKKRLQAAEQRKLEAIQEMEDLEASIFFKEKLEMTINSQELDRIELTQKLEACIMVLSRAKASMEALNLQTPLAVKEAREAYLDAKNKAAESAAAAAAADANNDGAAAAFKV